MPVAETLTALADPHRRRAVEMLAQGPSSAGELAANLGLSPAALTRHLRVLRAAGLVDLRLDPADTRRHIYHVLPDPIEELSDWSRQVTNFWQVQLASLTELAGQDGR
ncbi:MAG TPA: metalloregulator ArsR/SmtB family transcription factor [Acidimicrobiia bacterium]|nr:metalloregulator ArsR/SmtB family transcription factor [Acidimicrobiia bacterium]